MSNLATISKLQKKTFWNDNQTSYVEITLTETFCIAGNNYATVRLSRANTRGLRQGTQTIFENENYLERARKYFDSIVDLKCALKIIKVNENE